MEIHTDILNNINTRYVLLKKDSEYLIIDRLKKSMVIIDDPIIDKHKLVMMMIAKGVDVYHDPKELPAATEIPIVLKAGQTSFKLFIKKIFDKDGKETGSIISTLTNKTIDRNEKERIEKIIEEYAFTVLYPNEGLNIYSEINNDTASVTVIKGINNLPNVEWNEKELYNW